MIITNARIVTFDSRNRVLDSGEVEVSATGAIGRVANHIPWSSSEEVLDARGRLLMPALINCHTHLYSTLARGMALPRRAPGNFPEILEQLWWRLDRALSSDDIYYSALAGLVDYAKCGVATLLDHHSSPNACDGSLDIIEQAFREAGLRGALCYETSDRNGPASALQGIGENVRFIRKRAEKIKAKERDNLIGAGFGLHASFTLSDGTLREALAANKPLRAPFHIHVAEDRCDAGAARRLCKLGILNGRALAAHCVHVTDTEIGLLARHKVAVVHNPQSNCNNAVGTARLLDMMQRKVLVGLGSDGYSPRMWDEFRTAANLQKLEAGDPRVGGAEAYAAAFLNNRKIVRKLWGWEVGRIETGARADLILLDYFPPTPLDSRNVFGHLLFGIGNAAVDTLLVNGRYVVRNKECVTVDERRLAAQAAAQAQSLWTRFRGTS